MPQQKSKILIIDDDRAVCSSLTLLLNRKGYKVKSVHSPQIAIETIAEFNPDLILLDMNFTIDTSGKQGLRLLEMINSNSPDVSVILMTGWATVQLAVKGMKLGAKDFVAKPWDNKSLLTSIETILTLYTSKKSEIGKEKSSIIIGNSEAMEDVLNIARSVAPTHANILITGESGTGKELVAEAIHHWSKRSKNQFVKVNLGGISSSLFESEMFGHKKGAFTDASSDRVGRFEKADGGTIFLDEIGELPLVSQVKLLRVLQEQTYEVLGSSDTKKIDVRIISATNKNLVEMSMDGTFREDLLYRINLIHIHIPPLRERKEDIPALVNHFIQNISKIYNVDVPYLRNETYDYLSNLDFPGNIRQLKNLVDRAFLLNLTKKELDWKDFHLPDVNMVPSTKAKLPHVGAFSLEEIEIQMIKKALAFHNKAISKTAQSLGLTRSSLYRRLEKYNIDFEGRS